MLLSLLFSQPLVFLLLAAIILMSLTIHEFAHAFVADRLGDPTPRYQGRITLNPRAHLDPLGTVALFVAGFGWGKPVMFDPNNLKHPVRDAAIIALAGPVSNVIIALVAALALHLTVTLSLTGIISSLLLVCLPIIVFYNLMLAIFNLVPVYPLDGSKVLLALLPRQTALEYDQVMRRYGMFILLALILPWNGRSPLSSLIGPVINFCSNLLLGG